MPFDTEIVPDARRAARPAAKHIPFLDGVRACSVLLVFCSHYFSRLVPGALGVTVFFFISGFLITNLMLQEWAATGTIGKRDFYIRRFLRLLPALYVNIAFVAFAYRDQYGGGVDWQSVWMAVLYVYNYGSLYAEHAYPMPLWSLAVEEHYYIFFPWLFAALLSRGIRRTLIGLATLSAVVLVWRLVLNYGLHVTWQRIYVGTDTRIDSILYGAMLALLMHHQPWRDRIAARTNQHTIWLGAALLLVTLAFRGEDFRQTIRYTLQGIALALIIAPMVLGRAPSWIIRPLSVAPMVYLGRISYSLYLYHLAVLDSVTTLHLPHSWMTTAVALPLAFACACASYHFIERPFLKLRRAFGSAAPG